MYQRVIFGKVTHAVNEHLRDLSLREVAVLVPVLVFIIWIGIYPGSFLEPTAATAKQIISVVHPVKFQALTSQRANAPSANRQP